MVKGSIVSRKPLGSRKGISDTLFQLDYPQKAIQLFKEYLLLDPFNGEAYFKLGKAFHLIDDGDNAIMQIEKATQIFRDNLDIVWEAKAQQYLKLLKNQYTYN